MDTKCDQSYNMTIWVRVQAGRMLLLCESDGDRLRTRSTWNRSFTRVLTKAIC